MEKLLDVSSELLIQKRARGIVLISPDKAQSLIGPESLISVAEIFQLPINVCFLDTDSIIQNANEPMIRTTGFTSFNEAIGKTIGAVTKREIAERLMNNDREALNANQLIVKEDNYTRLVDDLDFQAITFKTPWYSEDNKILGVFFCSITIGLAESIPLAESLALIFKLGLFNSNPVSSNQLKNAMGLYIRGIYLTKRESQCLHYLARGKTMKMIGKILDISPRTVGHYLENLKAKFGVTSKSDLIEKTIDNLS
jgi:DNA-binding CsgD family transcriptional regulator